MSLILDALNKADRERDYRDAVPDLNTVHGVRRHAESRRLAWIIGSLVAAVVVLAVLLMTLWLRAPVAKPGDATAVLAPPKAQVQPPPTLPSPAAAPVVPDVPAADPSVPAQPSPSVSPEVQALYGVQEDPLVHEVEEPLVQPSTAADTPAALNADDFATEGGATPTAATPPRQSTVDEALVRELWEESKRQQQLPVPLPTESRPAAAAKPPAPPVDAPLDETLAGYMETPFLHELPVTVQNTIPTLMYARHDYQRGLVVINKTDLQMGDATTGGVLIEKVLADGLLLSLNGTKFKLASLSSWVNY